MKIKTTLAIWILFQFVYTVNAQYLRSINEKWQMHEEGSEQWINATVPGCVHTDLMSAGMIDDPFYGINEKNVQWVEEKNWEYKTIFVLTETELQHQNIEMIFDGLDTYADVYINDVLLLQADNMFRQWKINVKGNVTIGENTLRILFTSPVSKAKELAQKIYIKLPPDEKVFTRKAQYQYGWDWGPRLITSGIWQPVNLHFWDDLVIENIHPITKSISEKNAILDVLIEVNAAKTTDVEIIISDNGENQSAHYTEIRQGVTNITIPFEIKNPQLWWTYDLGTPFMYDYTIQVKQDGEIIDKKDFSFGLRTIELVTEEDSIGSTFYFKLNGKPVFMKGANFIPTDNFLHRTTDEQYQNQLLEIKNANMNMLRIWGGGIYENNIFYDLCDSLGILVWQDFMFACAMYPGDSAFIENVRAEVTYQVKRLRNHPSIALWCGNNEVDEAWHNWGWQTQYHYNAEEEEKIWSWYESVFHQLIPEVLSQTDTSRNYWPSSPSIGWGRKESLLSGDVHYWGVWWGNQSFDYYNEKIGRFMSEYGFQSMPSYRSFKKFTPDAELKYNSSTVKNHQKHPVGYETILTYMQRDYPASSDFASYIYLSQLLQARGISVAMEAHRRNRPYCMGTLFWQMNDCWPVTSWSAIDYYGNRKALYYASKKSFAPLAVSVIKNKDQYNCFLLADNNICPDLNAIVEVWQTDKGLLSADTIPIQQFSDTSFIFYTLNKNVYTTKAKKVIRVKLMCADSLLTDYYKYVVTPKELVLKKPDVQIIYQKDQGALTVKSDVFVAGLYLYTETNELMLSDNFFDLAPGEVKTLQLENASLYTGEEIKYHSVNTIRK